MRVMRYVVLLPLFAACGCGIFEPRQAEYPSNEAVQDPFSFASILWNTGKWFTKLEYNDMFYDTTTYVDINGNEYGRDMLIANLYKTQSRFEIRRVSWTMDSLQDFTVADTFFMDRKYDIVARDTMVIPPKDYEFNDKASFKLIFNSTKNTWNIFYWKDKYPGQSIFHPLFTPDY